MVKRLRHLRDETADTIADNCCQKTAPQQLLIDAFGKKKTADTLKGIPEDPLPINKPETAALIIV